MKFFFVNDGMFGLDKLGHFTRHTLMSLAGLAMGCTTWGIIYYDSAIDLLYEYMNGVSGVGFSWRDIIAGRLGMITMLLLWQYATPIIIFVYAIVVSIIFAALYIRRMFTTASSSL